MNGTFEPEEKVVTPSSVQQVITPSAGKYLRKVTVKDVSLKDFGIDYGTFVAPGLTTVEIQHNLGTIPSFYAVMPKVGYRGSLSSMETFAWIFNAQLRTHGLVSNALEIEVNTANVTENTITFDLEHYYLAGGVEHIWFAVK